MNCLVLVFSKDRALQLDAALRSFFHHCKDAGSSLVRVLYTTSAPLFQGQYETLEKEFSSHASLRFIREKDFRVDLLALLAPFEHICFLVDDNIFVRSFSLGDVTKMLEDQPDVLGCSLRLGRNTSYCYPLNASQRLPEFLPIDHGLLKFDWTKGEHDFGYPLEISSSVYRTADLIPFVAQIPFRNPNTLEALMDAQKSVFQEKTPFLSCYEKSVTFCAPLNVVQNLWPNRSSARQEYSAAQLAHAFGDGARIDISAYQDFVPDACHHEVEIKLIGGKELPSETPQPLVSVIIPCYNHANYLPEAVESVVSQTYTNLECIIVNDGSPDNTAEVAQALIDCYPDRKIILLDKENGGLADARNFGIRSSKGKYILPLDADDKIHPDMLGKTVAALESDPAAAFVFTFAVHFDEETGIQKTGGFHEFDPRKICAHNCFSYCTLYRREVWETTGGYNTNMVWGYEDWDFWVGAVEKGFRGKQLPVPLFYYREKAISMITKAVEHDAELKARIVLNHPGLYNPLQVAWAKGIMAKDPRIMSIPHREGIVPGFYEPLPQDIAGSEPPPEPVPHEEFHACIQQADTHIAAADYPAAREALKKAIPLAPDNPKLIESLCDYLTQLGDPAAAEEFRKARGIK